jgi:heme O synthase-like polyprenyltransferase
LLVAVPLGLGLLRHAWILKRRGGNRFAWRMYRYSSFYLAGIFVALALDALLVK